ncbi:MAG TPA: retropepsin-like aspartic protease [Acidisarcina sp.]
MNTVIRRLISPLVICSAGIFYLALPAVGQVSRLSDMSTAAMLDCKGLPCVDVTTSEGKHLRMGLDTGNQLSFIDEAVAGAMGLKQEPYVNSAGKEVPGVKLATLPRVILGSGSLGDVRVAVIDLARPIKAGTFPAVDGTIAYGAFKKRVMQLDYAKKVFSYSGVRDAANPCPVAQCGKINLITFGQHGPPIVVASGFTLNGKPLNVQIDTMFAGTMLVFPTAVERLGLKSQSASAKTRHFPFTDEGVDMFEANGVKEGFAGRTLLPSATVYFAGPKVHLPDGLFDGTVGAELFAGHRLTMDFNGMNVWVD